MIYPLQAKAVSNSLQLQKLSLTVTSAFMALHLLKKLLSIAFFMHSSAFKEEYAHLRYSQTPSIIHVFIKCQKAGLSYHQMNKSIAR